MKFSDPKIIALFVHWNYLDFKDKELLLGQSTMYLISRRAKQFGRGCLLHLCLLLLLLPPTTGRGSGHGSSAHSNSHVSEGLAHHIGGDSLSESSVFSSSSDHYSRFGGADENAINSRYGGVDLAATNSRSGGGTSSKAATTTTTSIRNSSPPPPTTSTRTTSAKEAVVAQLLRFCFTSVGCDEPLASRGPE